MKTKVIAVTAAELKELVNLVKNAESKSDLTDIVVEVPEIFPKKMLTEYKGTNSMRGAMLDLLEEVEVEKPKDTRTELEIFHDAIRTACASNKNAEHKVDLIKRIIASYEDGESAPVVEKKPKAQAKPASKVTSKPVAKAEPETPSQLHIVEEFMLKQNGDWFCLEDLIEEVAKYYSEPKPHTLRSYMADSKLGKKYVFDSTNNGHQWYRIAKTKKVA